MNPKQTYYEHTAKTIIRNLGRRQMEGHYCATCREAVVLASSMLGKADTVSFGGSMTLQECGMMDCLKADKTLTLLDRTTAQSPEQTAAIYRQAFSADTYFMSTNGITLDGELLNMDGTGNRVAALIYGPKQVIILAGMNKIVPNIPDGIRRIHNMATPPNCIRLDRKTPCSITGKCADCYGDDCICNQLVITRRSGILNRIKVILIGEELGY